MIRILLADDHPVVREGLAAMLGAQPGFEIVGSASDGAEAVALHTDLRPDVTLMDLRMPGVDGVSAIAQIRSSDPQAHILVLTTYDSDADIVRSVEAGAVGYLLKDAPREELFLAVRRAAAGESALSPSIASRMMSRMRAPESSSLTSREIDVLELLATGSGNQAIADELHISLATVKTHLVHIYDKLGVDDRTSAVTAALERGIISLG
jgi:DNA-binding NarL/FixJ family response regulator